MTYSAGVRDSRGPTLTSTMVTGPRLRAFASGTAPTSQLWPVANQAYAISFELAVPMPISEAWTYIGATGVVTTIDLGIYNDQFQRIASLGSTATTAGNNVISPAGGGVFATPFTLVRGRYYMAMSCAVNTLTVYANVQANHIVRALGMQTMATAHPLPPTFVPASMGTTAFIPTMGFSSTTNIL